MLTQPKAFPRQALNTITFMSASDIFFSNSQTDAGMPQRIQAAEDGDMRRTCSLWLLENKGEVVGS